MSTHPGCSQARLLVNFQSDWHVGEGAGQPGHIDRLVRRHPEDNLPFVPAKTLTGIWRDACEAVAAGLGQGWDEWVAVAFGDQPALRQAGQKDYGSPIRPASLAVRPARFSEILRQHLVRPENTSLRQAVTFIKPGVKIDRQSGQAVDQCLRFEEVVRGGVTLQSAVTLTGLDERSNAAAWALLWAGTRVVERLGGKRRRGLGRCQFTLAGLPWSEAELLAILAQHAPDVPEPRQVSLQAAAAPVTTTEAAWFILPLQLTLAQPVVVPARTTGNVVESLDFIPGTYLLGPVTRCLGPLIRQHLQRDLLPLVAGGEVRVTNAYVQVPAGPQRCLPLPLSLYAAKDGGGLKKGGRVWNRLRETAPLGQQVKPHASGYVGPCSDGTRPAFVESRGLCQQTTHNTVEDESQRPTEAVGGVYTFEAIRAGTTLCAELRIRRELVDALPARWWGPLAGEVRLGVAKKDDYGLALLESGAPRQEVAGEVSPTLQGVQPGSTSQALAVWLLSDVLMRDEHLRQAPTIASLIRELETSFQRHGSPVRLRKRDAAGEPTAPLPAVVRTRRTESWHVGWGLPQPSRIGLMAGSCIVLDIEGTVPPPSIVRAVELEGIGERRGEGFGELSFNHPLVTGEVAELKTRVAPVSRSGSGGTAVPPPIAASEAAEFGYGRLLEKAAWRQAIQRGAAQLGGASDWRWRNLHWSDKKPKNSQLGMLRALVAQLTAPGENSLTDWLTHLESLAAGRERWPEAARQALADLASHPGRVWEWLADSDWPTITDAARQALRSELWPLAVRALLLASVQGEVREREHGGTTPSRPGVQAERR